MLCCGALETPCRVLDLTLTLTLTLLTPTPTLIMVPVMVTINNHHFRPYPNPYRRHYYSPHVGLHLQDHVFVPLTYVFVLLLDEQGALHVLHGRWDVHEKTPH